MNRGGAVVDHQGPEGQQGRQGQQGHQGHEKELLMPSSCPWRPLLSLGSPFDFFYGTSYVSTFFP